MEKAIKLYISHSDEDEDLLACDRLIHHFTTLVENNKINIITRKDIIPGQEKEKGLKGIISKSNIAIILISADYLAMDGSELKLLYDNYKNKSIKKLFLIKVKPVEYESLTMLRNLPLLDSSDEYIVYDHKINESILQRVTVSLSQVISNTKYDIPFQDLKSRLSFVAKESNIIFTIKLLIQLINNTSKVKLLKKYESEYIKSYNAFGHNNFKVSNNENELKRKIEQWKEERSDLTQKVEQIIREISEIEIVDSWRDIYISEILGLTPTIDESKSFYFLFTLADKIKEPKNKKLSDEEKKEYKRLFYQSQDLIAVEKFEDAYNIAVKIRNSIEPESTQLYEYLLLSYFKMIESKEIIREAIEGAGIHLKHIVLYSGRYKEFQSDNEFDNSHTGEINIKGISERLFEALLIYYQKINHDYAIIDKTERKSENRTTVEKCIDVALTIYKYIESTSTFLDIAINELGGGGKFEWVKVVEPKKGEWELRDNSNYNASNLLKDIALLISEKKDTTKDDSLAKNLLTSLQSKYNRIKKLYFNNKIDQSSLRKSLIKCIEAFKVGFVHFSDKRFLEIPIDELKGNGILYWLTFDSNGTLVDNKESQVLKFNAKSNLEKMIAFANGVEYLEVAKQNVINSTYRWFVSNPVYNYKRIIKTKNKGITHRKKLVECIHHWKTCYRVKNNRIYIEKCLEEIIGNKSLIWFDIKNNKLSNNKECKEIGFDAIDEIRYYTSVLEDQKINELIPDIVNNIYRVNIKGVYLHLKSNNQLSKFKLLNLMSMSLNCYRLYKINKFISFIYQELVLENTYQWFDVKGGEIQGVDSNFAFCESFLIDFSEVTKSKSEYSLNSIRKVIANNRFQDIMLTYNTEINENRSLNNQIDRELMINLIEMCIECYKADPLDEYISMPINELEGNGKIRWFYNLFLFNYEHHENRVLNFSRKTKLDTLYKLQREALRSSFTYKKDVVIPSQYN